MSILQASNLTFERAGKKILDDVSITITKGDFVTIVGPNGAGKSMLLRCLLGLQSLTRGNITKQKDLRIGYMPQRVSAETNIPITVKRFLGLAKSYPSERLEKLLAIIPIRKLLNKQLSDLSGGELQSTLLTRSLLGCPHLLVLDEPAQNLDIIGQINFYQIISRLYEEEKLSILMVSHDLHMVMASTKKVVCLYHHICCSGTPQAVTSDPEFGKLFGNKIVDMLAVYQHAHTHNHD